MYIKILLIIMVVVSLFMVGKTNDQTGVEVIDEIGFTQTNTYQKNGDLVSSHTHYKEGFEPAYKMKIIPGAPNEPN